MDRLIRNGSGQFSPVFGLVNFAAFQLGWLICVLGGAHGFAWVGVVTVAVVIGYHLYNAVRPREEAVLIGIVALIGFVWDSLLLSLTDMHYASGMLLAHLAPYWLVAMWMQFATTLNVSLRWLRQHWWLAAVLGSIVGPLTYYSGAKLGAVTFDNPVLSLILLTVGWAALMPGLFALATRFDGMVLPVRTAN